MVQRRKKGGSGLETQTEYEQMMKENTFSIKEYEDNMKKKQLALQEELRKLRAEQAEHRKRKKEIRKDCSALTLLLAEEKLTKKEKELYADKMYEHKIKCDNGDLQACRYCKGDDDSFLKKVVQKKTPRKKRSKTKQ